MIIPSIDIQMGQAVQLIGGEKLAIEGGDPFKWADQFAVVGDLAVIDLDAARAQGENTLVISELVRRYACRVGGGIRSLERARYWLDRGAKQIIIGTVAAPEFLSQLPRNRLIAALDCRGEEVVVDGWRTRTGEQVLERITLLAPYVSGFLVTFVEREGRLAGGNIDLAKALKAKLEAFPGVSLTVAGGVASRDEIKTLAELGIDCQLGMSLYSGHLKLSEAYTALLAPPESSTKLWPTVVVDRRGCALGLAWSSELSLQLAIAERRGIYQSRSRGLWRKGETSGATQELVKVELDCDRDTLKFVVDQKPPGFCHRQQQSCWGSASGLSLLESTLIARYQDAPADSYSRRLFNNPPLLSAKLSEEAAELAEAKERTHVVHEAADLTFFMLTKLRSHGVSFAEVEAELDRRSKRITRRIAKTEEERKYV